MVVLDFCERQLVEQIAEVLLGSQPIGLGGLEQAVKGVASIRAFDGTILEHQHGTFRVPGRWRAGICFCSRRIGCISVCAIGTILDG